MTTAGPRDPGTMANVNIPSGVDWSNPDNAKISNNVYAVATTTIPGFSSYLKASNFGFTIPAGATIKGIIVEIERNRLGGAGTILDKVVSIVKSDGSIGAENKKLGTAWNTTIDTYYSYGGETDLWSEAWETTDINDSDFGVVLQADHGASQIGQRDPSVDHIRITVYYTEGGGGGSSQEVTIPGLMWWGP